MKIELSEEQKLIKNHINDAMLVLASAGSGKTRVLTERIKFLLEELEGNFHILALTFTVKAAEEMKTRLQDVKNITKRSFIGNIHSFCLDVIIKQGYSINLLQVPHLFEKYEDTISLLIQVLEKKGNEDLKNEYTNKTVDKQKEFIKNALEYISSEKKNLKGIEKFSHLDIHSKNLKVQRLYNEYNNLLHEQNAMDYDDIILYAYQIFAKHPSIAKIYRKLYKYISVDEAQDLNLAQYELIKILCNGEHKNVLMVGDTNQSLYHFNGSDVKYMKEYFVKDFDAKIVNLNINYRSSKSIINIANKVKNQAMKGIETNIEGIFNIQKCENEESEAIWIVDKIEELKKLKTHKDIEGEINNQSFAILARNKYLFQYIEKELDKRKIQYFLKNSNDGNLDFDSFLLQLFDLGLRVLVNSQDQLHYFEILKLLNIDFEISHNNEENGFLKLQNLTNFIHLELKNDFEILLTSWNLIYKNINNFLNSLEILEKYSETFEEDKISERLKILSDTNIFKNLWKIYARNTNSELKSLQHFKTQLAIGTIIPNQKNNGITLSTIHLVMGLEFDIVFICGVTQNAFPDYRALKLGENILEEEKNIFYVAVIRSKRFLYITYPENRFMPWAKNVAKKQDKSDFIKLIENN